MTVTERVPILRPPLAADLGVAYARCGNLAEGLAHLHAAVDSATAMGRLSRLPLIQVKCGEIHLLAGEVAAAARLAEDALRLAIDQNERGNVVYARYLLAEIHSLDRLHSHGAAEQHYRDALTLGTKLGMKPLVARCNAGLGTLRMRNGKPKQADRPLLTARAMYRSHGHALLARQARRRPGGARVTGDLTDPAAGRGAKLRIKSRHGWLGRPCPAVDLPSIRC